MTTGRRSTDKTTRKPDECRDTEGYRAELWGKVAGLEVQMHEQCQDTKDLKKGIDRIVDVLQDNGGLGLCSRVVVLETQCARRITERARIKQRGDRIIVGVVLASVLAVGGMIAGWVQSTWHWIAAK